MAVVTLQRKHPRRPQHHTQRGAALLMAMMIVALVSTMAAAMVWQQWRAVQVEAAERARAQSDWILNGALDWARLILREDGKSAGNPVDHLGEPWAVPLAEARLSTFLAADKNVSAEDGPDAFLSGSITDAQSRYNLRNLVKNGVIDPKEVAVAQALFDHLNVSRELVTVIARGLKSGLPVTAPPPQQGASAPPPPPPEADPNPTVLPQTLLQLTWLGLNEETLRRLEPHVTLLPKETKVNVNTASREVLAAVLELDLGSAEQLVQTRQRTPYKNPNDVIKQRDTSAERIAPRISVTTDYFEIRGRLRLDDKALEERTLVLRTGSGNTTRVAPLFRERVNLSGTP